MEEIKVMPHSEKAERGVLGSVLLDPSSLSRCKLKPEHFYNVQHRELYDQLLSMDSSGACMDAITIGEWLKDRNTLAKIGGYDKLIELQDAAIVPNHIKDYARTVREKADRRKEIEICSDGVTSAYKGVPAASEVITRLSASEDVERESLNVEEHAEQFLSDCKVGAVGHLEWWCPEWTQHLGNLSTELVIIHAPRSTGKTAMMLQWITENHRAGHTTPLVSIEMLKKALAPRFVANIGQVSTFTMKSRGCVTQDEEQKTRRAIEEIRGLEIRVRDDEASIDDIFRYAVEENRRKKISALWIDNLLCINDGGVQYQSKTIMYDAFIKKFRELRNILQVPIFILAHPNAEGGVAWSKDVENIADIIISLQEVPSEGFLLKSTGKHIMQRGDVFGKHIMARFTKNRDGISPVASLDFVGSTQTFNHIAWEE